MKMASTAAVLRQNITQDWTAETWDWPLQNNEGFVKVNNTKEKFEVSFDVKFFSPNEIEVKVSGQELLINCRHEIRAGPHGSITRDIHRAYKLPSDVDASTLQSHLNNRGILNITAAKKY